MKFFSVSCLLSLFSVFALCSPSFSEGEAEGPDLFAIRLGIKEPNEPSQLFLNPTEHTIFLTRDELGEFLKQDTQKQLLSIHEPKYKTGVDDRAFDSFAKECGFPFAEFVPDVGMFQVLPIVGPHHVELTPTDAVK